LSAHTIEIKVYRMLKPQNARTLRAAAIIVALLALPIGARADSFIVSSSSTTLDTTAIPASDWLWFSAVFTVSNAPTTPFDIYVEGGQITLNGTSYTVPSETLMFDPSDKTTTATFANGAWTVQGAAGSGTYLLDAFAIQAPAGGFAGSLPATWTLDLATDATGAAAGVSIDWQWAATVYSSTFPGTSLGSLGVLPVSGSDPAGTPENYKSLLLTGSKGGTGGTSYTGNDTTLVDPGLLCKTATPEPSTAALFVIGASLVILGRRVRYPSRS
jgi:hypothetical protein